MKNNEIREAAKRAGIKLWQIADVYGVSDCNFSKKLRKELPATEKEKILSIIMALADEQEKGE